MNKYQKQIFKGTLYALLSGIVWGICGILGEYFFAHYSVTSGWITSMRLVIAGLVVLVIAAIQDSKKIWGIWKKKKNIFPFVTYAILGVFSVQFFFYLCIQYSNAVTATILQYISPVFMLVYDFFIAKKRISNTALIYVVLAMVGVFLMTTKGDLSNLSITPLALLFGLLSALAVVFNVVLPQRFARRYGLLNTVGWGMLTAGLLSNFLYPIYHVPFKLDGLSIAISIIIALFGTAFSFLISMKAASLVSPLIVSVVGASEPLSSAVLSVLFLGMVLDMPLVIAMLLIIVPMALLSIEESTLKK